MITEAALAKKAVELLVEAVRKDQANRYVLVKDWVLPRLTSVKVPDYNGQFIRIKDNVITVLAYGEGICNGCTLSPDEIGKWKPVIGAIFHDPWYREMAEIADAWKWPQRVVRKLGDEIFACILVATGTPVWLTRLYLTGVRMGGGIVRFIASLSGKTILSILLLSGAAGCGGCVMPDHFGGAPVDEPTYEETTDAGK